jgi:hypothetical protein
MTAFVMSKFLQGHNFIPVTNDVHGSINLEPSACMHSIGAIPTKSRQTTKRIADGRCRTKILWQQTMQAL